METVPIKRDRPRRLNMLSPNMLKQLNTLDEHIDKNKGLLRVLMELNTPEHDAIWLAHDCLYRIEEQLEQLVIQLKATK